MSCVLNEGVKLIQLISLILYDSPARQMGPEFLVEEIKAWGKEARTSFIHLFNHAFIQNTELGAPFPPAFPSLQ